MIKFQNVNFTQYTSHFYILYFIFYILAITNQENSDICLLATAVFADFCLYPLWLRNTGFHYFL